MFRSWRHHSLRSRVEFPCYVRPTEAVCVAALTRLRRREFQAPPGEHDAHHLQDNKIVDWGTNRPGNAFTFLGYKAHCKIHSEVDAYRKAKGLMIKGTPFEIVNIRLTKDSRIRSSCPCKCCWNFLKNLGCKKMYFSTDMEDFAYLSFSS